MLVSLNLKGSLRMRRNGLLEFRSADLGSIYGRTKEEIRGKIEAKLNQMGLALPGKEKKACPRLSEFFEQKYLPYKESQGLAENTLKGIKYNYAFILQSGFDKRLDRYTTEQIEEFLRAITLPRKKKIMQGLLNNIFKRALALSLIKVNPCAALEPVKHTGKEGSSLSFREQRSFFEALFAAEMPLTKKLFLIFVYLTGARRGEALALRPCDVDVVGKILHLPGTKTDGSDREIPLFPLVEKLLALIPAEKGGKFFPYSGRWAQEAFRSCMGEGHKLHDLRHTFGTLCICCDKLDIKTVSMLMGHSTIDTTLRIYTHPEALDRALFYRGDLSAAEKTAILQGKKAEIMGEIAAFLDSRTQNVPKK